jgi:hypothetical protein
MFLSGRVCYTLSISPCASTGNSIGVFGFAGATMCWFAGATMTFAYLCNHSTPLVRAACVLVHSILVQYMLIHPLFIHTSKQHC